MPMPCQLQGEIFTKTLPSEPTTLLLREDSGLRIDDSATSHTNPTIPSVRRHISLLPVVHAIPLHASISNVMLEALLFLYQIPTTKFLITLEAFLGLCKRSFALTTKWHQLPLFPLLPGCPQTL